MSLAISVVQGDYIIASSDTAVTEFPYDNKKFLETGEYERTGGMIKTNFKSEKVHRISDKVLLLTTGNSFLTITIETELKHLVNPEDDLDTCREKAKIVIENMRNKKLNHLEEIIKKYGDQTGWTGELVVTAEQLVEMDHTLSQIDNDIGFSAYLAGFITDSGAGLVNIVSDELAEVKGKAYPTLIAGEHPGYDKTRRTMTFYQKQLYPPFEQRALTNYIQAITLVHAQISYNRINISPDCNFHILQKDGDEIIYSKFTRDTATLHEEFKRIEIDKEPQK